jgi:hypothetical protein
MSGTGQKHRLALRHLGASWVMKNIGLVTERLMQRLAAW